MADADRGPIFIGVTVMFEALALIAVGFRLWSLQLLKRRILAHDMLLLAGFVGYSRLTWTLSLTIHQAAFNNAVHMPHVHRDLWWTRSACR